MMRRQAILLGIAAGAMLVSGCDPFPERYSFRYRLTVEVETPQGLKTGSSVIEHSATEGSGIPDKSIRTSTKGEAVAIDLPNGKSLFALLRTPDDNRQVYIGAAFADALAALPKDADWKMRSRTIATQTRPGVVPAEHLPMFVWFRDIRDPKTVEAVSPDEFKTAFGAGTRLRRVTVQITDEPITRGIAKRFLWWDQYKNRNFDNSSTSIRYATQKTLASTMNSGSFSTEPKNEQ